MTLKVIHEPEPPDWEKYPHPTESAKNYRQGTIVEDERGIQWRVYFDEQDRQLEWERVKPKRVRRSSGKGSGDE